MSHVPSPFLFLCSKLPLQILLCPSVYICICNACMSDCWEPTLLGALVVYEVISTDERVKSGDRQTVWGKRLLIKTHFIKFSLPPHIYSSASVSWCPTCSLSVQDTNAKASGWARIPEHPVRKKNTHSPLSPKWPAHTQEPRKQTRQFSSWCW